MAVAIFVFFARLKINNEQPDGAGDDTTRAVHGVGGHSTGKADGNNDNNSSVLGRHPCQHCAGAGRAGCRQRRIS